MQFYRDSGWSKEAGRAEREALQHAWYNGAGTVIAILLGVRADGTTQRLPEAARTHVLEAWDREVVERAISMIRAADSNRPVAGPGDPKEP
jgi:hypothetical protein